MLPMVLIPAYGRKYKSEKEVLKDFQEGKDFKVNGGPYCSVRDFKGQTVYIRWTNNLYAEVKA